SGSNEIRPSPVDRWAEPLDAATARVLVADLASRLPKARVSRFPDIGTPSPDAQVSVEVRRFEGDGEGHAVLWARWEVREGSTRGSGAAQEARLARPAPSASAADLAREMSAALADLSGEIAAALAGR